MVAVENRVRALLAASDTRPIRFLVMDLSNVDGFDFSSAEAFTRINRILRSKAVRMTVCGFTSGSDVERGLHNVGLLNEASGVECFEGLNPALEYCENQLLAAFYQRRGDMFRRDDNVIVPGVSGGVSPSARQSTLEESLSGSPRYKRLHEAATAMLEEHQDIVPLHTWPYHDQPLQLILQTFAFMSSMEESLWKRCVPYFQRQECEAGAVLYHTNDVADAFYILETGILKARYQIPGGLAFSEVMVAGTTCGELPFFSGTRRTSTTFADRKSILWFLDRQRWDQLQDQEPVVARELLKLSLNLTSERMQTITKYMLFRGL